MAVGTLCRHIASSEQLLGPVLPGRDQQCVNSSGATACTCIHCSSVGPVPSHLHPKVLCVDGRKLKVCHDASPSKPPSIERLLCRSGCMLSAKLEVDKALQSGLRGIEDGWVPMVVCSATGLHTSPEGFGYPRTLLFLSTNVCCTCPNLLHSALTSSPISTSHVGSVSLLMSRPLTNAR